MPNRLLIAGGELSLVATRYLPFSPPSRGMRDPFLVMVGFVTTRHLITHSHMIVHEFGLRCYFRCVWRTLTAHRSVTFLECIDSSSARTSMASPVLHLDE